MTAPSVTADREGFPLATWRGLRALAAPTFDAVVSELASNNRWAALAGLVECEQEHLATPEGANGARLVRVFQVVMKGAAQARTVDWAAMEPVTAAFLRALRGRPEPLDQCFARVLRFTLGAHTIPLLRLFQDPDLEFSALTHSRYGQAVAVLLDSATTAVPLAGMLDALLPLTLKQVPVLRWASVEGATTKGVEQSLLQRLTNGMPKCPDEDVLAAVKLLVARFPGGGAHPAMQEALEQALAGPATPPFAGLREDQLRYPLLLVAAGVQLSDRARLHLGLDFYHDAGGQDLSWPHVACVRLQSLLLGRAALRELQTQGIDLEAPDTQGRRLLLTAVHFRNAVMAHALLDLGVVEASAEALAECERALAMDPQQAGYGDLRARLQAQVALQAADRVLRRELAAP